MNTTLSASQETSSKHLLPPNAGHDHLSIEVPHGEALRRLSALNRLKLRFAIWLLLRTRAAPDGDAISHDLERAERRARIEAQRARLSEYETQRQLQLAVRSRTL